MFQTMIPQRAMRLTSRFPPRNGRLAPLAERRLSGFCRNVGNDRIGGANLQVSSEEPVHGVNLLGWGSPSKRSAGSKLADETGLGPVEPKKCLLTLGRLTYTDLGQSS